MVGVLHSKQPISTLYVEFCRWTSLHGLMVSGAVIPQHIALRTLFSLSFVAAFVCYSVQIYLLIMAFLEYEANTMVSLDQITGDKDKAVESMVGQSRKKRNIESIQGTSCDMRGNTTENSDFSHTMCTGPDKVTHEMFCVDACEANRSEPMHLCHWIGEQQKCSVEQWKNIDRQIENIFRKCIEPLLCDQNFCNETRMLLDATACARYMTECGGLPVSDVPQCYSPQKAMCLMVSDICHKDSQILQCADEQEQRYIDLKKRVPNYDALEIPTEFSLVDLIRIGSPMVAILSDLAKVLDIEPNQSSQALHLDVAVKLLEEVADLNATLRQEMGYSQKQMIISCNLGGQSCRHENNWTNYLDADYGNCFTLNGHWPLNFSQWKPGYGSGLRMTIMSNLSEYLSTTQQAGARVAIHQPNAPPFPNVNGYSVSVGSSVSFRIRYREIERLTAPYGNCSAEITRDQYFYPGNYSHEACLRSCFQRLVIKECGCTDARFNKDPAKNHSACRSFNAKQSAKSFKNKWKTCRDGTFSVIKTKSVWPAYGNELKICPAALLKSVSIGCSELLRLNAVDIEIFYDQFAYEVYTETPKISAQKLWNQVSGAGGFWFSISLISTVEVMLGFTQLFLYLCRSPHMIPDIPNCSPDDGDFAGEGPMRRGEVSIPQYESTRGKPGYNPRPSQVVPFDPTPYQRKNPAQGARARPTTPDMSIYN